MARAWLLLPLFAWLALAPASRAQPAWQAGWSADEAKAVQESLIWSGDYFGLIDGQVGNLTRRAIADWQGDNGYAPTGYLEPAQAARLVDAAAALRQEIGFGLLSDPATGITVGFPFVLMDAIPRPLDQYGVEYVAADGTASMTLSRFPCPDAACWDSVYDGVRANLDGVAYEYHGDSQISVNGTSGGQYVVYFARRPAATAAVFQLTMPRENPLWLSLAMAIGTYIDPFTDRGLTLVPLLPPAP
ncbi:MAG: peptidoglycan-binding domain-containing protein [Alphaproteobacteria bacterium]